LRIELIVLAESPELRALATVYQADLKKIGVELTLAPMTFAEWQTRVSEKRTFDGYTGIWSQGWELDFEPVWHSKNSGPNQGNHVGYANPEVDRLASEFKSTLDVDARKAMALRIQELIAQDQPLHVLVRAAQHDRLSHGPRKRRDPYRAAAAVLAAVATWRTDSEPARRRMGRYVATRLLLALPTLLLILGVVFAVVHAVCRRCRASTSTR
jgi:ABC-type transport system substrate-binding protein